MYDHTDSCTGEVHEQPVDKQQHTFFNSAFKSIILEWQTFFKKTQSFWDFREPFSKKSLATVNFNSAEGQRFPIANIFLSEGHNPIL